MILYSPTASGKETIGRAKRAIAIIAIVTTLACIVPIYFLAGIVLLGGALITLSHIVFRAINAWAEARLNSIIGHRNTLAQDDLKYSGRNIWWP